MKVVQRYVTQDGGLCIKLLKIKIVPSFEGNNCWFIKYICVWFVNRISYVWQNFNGSYNTPTYTVLKLTSSSHPVIFLQFLVKFRLKFHFATCSFFRSTVHIIRYGVNGASCHVCSSPVQLCPRCADKRAPPERPNGSNALLPPPP